MIRRAVDRADSAPDPPITSSGRRPVRVIDQHGVIVDHARDECEVARGNSTGAVEYQDGAAARLIAAIVDAGGMLPPGPRVSR